jgi:hypothetical protein
MHHLDGRRHFQSEEVLLLPGIHWSQNGCRSFNVLNLVRLLDETSSKFLSQRNCHYNHKCVSSCHMEPTNSLA